MYPYLSVFLALLFVLTLTLPGCRYENPDSTVPTNEPSASITESTGKCTDITQPSVTVTSPTNTTTAPTGESTDPTEPTQPVTVPVQGTTHPAQGTTPSTQSTTQPTQDTIESTQSTTQPVPVPTDTPTEPTNAPTESDDGLLTYEEYLALSAADKRAYKESFEGVEDFFDWLNAAIKEHDEQKNSVDISQDGSIDLDDIVNGSN